MCRAIRTASSPFARVSGLNSKTCRTIAANQPPNPLHVSPLSWIPMTKVAERSVAASNDFARLPQTPSHRDLLIEQRVIAQLERRLGRTYARQRLGIERDHEARMFRDDLRFFHTESWYAAPWLIRGALRLAGLYKRAQQNAERVVVRENIVRSQKIPESFHGYSILHITDMHVDISEGAMRRLADLLPGLNYDCCVLTGDYRGKT